MARMDKKYVKVKPGCIGEGSFGKAYLARNMETKQLVVIKKCAMAHLDSNQRSSARKEAVAMKKLQHPNIIRFIDVWRDIDDVWGKQDSRDGDPGYLYIEMEYADGGDLRKTIEAFDEALVPEMTVMEIFVQVCFAMVHIHDKKVFHRDLKPSNIFLSKTRQVKVGDFGCSTFLSHTLSYLNPGAHHAGTEAYSAPEVFEGATCSFSADVWSCGVVLLYMLLSGKLCNNLMATYRSPVGVLPPIEADYSPSLHDLLQKMLNRAHGLRPSFREVLSHQFIEPLAPLVNDRYALGIDLLDVRPKVYLPSLAQTIRPCIDESSIDSVGSACAKTDSNPFLDNLWKGLLNMEQWTGEVACAIMEEISVEEYRAKSWFLISSSEQQDATTVPPNMQDHEWVTEGNTRYVRRWQFQYESFVDVVLAHLMSSEIKSVTEYRSTMTGVLPLDPLLHHAFLLVELQDGYGLCVEKYNHRLEVICARWDLLLGFGTVCRADGSIRKAAHPQPTIHLPRGNGFVVSKLLHWLEQIKWNEYDLAKHNCQEFAKLMTDALFSCNEDAEVAINCEVVLAAVKRNGRELRNVPLRFREDVTIVQAAVRQNGHALQFAEGGLRANRAVVILAVKNRGTSLCYAAEELQEDEEIQRIAVAQNNLLASCLVCTLREDERILLQDVKGEHPSALRSASPKMVYDAEFVKKSLLADPAALQHLPSTIRENCGILAVEAERSATILPYMSPETRRIVINFGPSLRAVSTGRISLGEVDESRRIRQVCLAAIERDGRNLEFVPEELKTSEICLDAVSRFGRSLAFVPSAVMSPKICREAVLADSSSQEFVPGYMKTNELCDLIASLEAVREEVTTPSAANTFEDEAVADEEFSRVNRMLVRRKMPLMRTASRR